LRWSHDSTLTSMHLCQALGEVVALDQCVVDEAAIHLV
jgi:hypothetical protein